MTQQFWMILNPTARAPTFQHKTRKSADDEARRLARLNPGETFIILEAVCAVTRREFDVKEFRRAPASDAPSRGIDPDMPF